MRTKIFISVHGPRGGYCLACERQLILIGDIDRAVREMGPASNQIKEGERPTLSYKVVRPLWIKLQNDQINQLDALNVEDQRSRADNAGLVREGGQNLNFLS